jgi:inorganic phosphate transporter, PiT family
MAAAWLLTLPAAGIVGALCWALAHAIGGLGGVLVVFGILVGLSGYMYLRSKKNPVDTSNVNEDWDGGLTPPSEKVKTSTPADPANV